MIRHALGHMISCRQASRLLSQAEDGELAWFLERGGRSLLTFTDDPGAGRAAAVALADLVSTRRVASILVERVDVSPDGVDIRLRTDGLTGLTEELAAVRPEGKRAA